MADRDDDWYAAEQPLGRGAVEELQRLKRRARARWLPILLIAIALTAAFVYKRSRKVRIRAARVVLAVTEGSLAQRNEPMPVQELREYVVERLLSNDAIKAIIAAHDLTPLRRTFGDEYAVGEFRDALEVEVTRNYFLYEYQIDSPRSARVTIAYEDPDTELSWTIVHEVADAIIAAQRARLDKMASNVEREAKAALEQMRGEVSALEEEVATADVALARARDTDDANLPALESDASMLHARLYRENARIAALQQQADNDQNVAAIVRSGLALSLEIAEEVRPPNQGPPPLYFQIILGGVFLFLALPAVAIFVGAFDTRVHDREDVERIGLPVVGHLPGFTGDAVGSLRARGARGARRRRVPF